MAAVSAVGHSTHTPNNFIPAQPRQITLVSFNTKFAEGRKVLKNTCSDETSAKPLLVPQIGDGIALIAVQVDPKTQKVARSSGLHMTSTTDAQLISRYVSSMDEKGYELFLYVVGGNEKSEGHEALLETMAEALRKVFGYQDRITARLINQVNHPYAQAAEISVGITQIGEVFWCYGAAS